ncbi:TIGR02300 family protein [Methylobrevis albus]|uniref:TIGR02300 family protein n=1 Tax=Methylobrevis albus TaxID=2793297 RepID=A0A931HZF9_9HYPH|nr:TIGR02300 family protein [Methylobrevis albus]MBH0236203.1 TIGR02300 family protein [Methylobrevis albus]
MAKEELGTKRICPETGRKFYDLNRIPIVSPFTGKSYPLSAFEVVLRSKAAPERAVKVVEEEEIEEEEDAALKPEFVPLEDAEPDADDDVPDLEEAGIVADDDEEVVDAFLEEDEDGDDDVADIIGDVESEDER